MTEEANTAPVKLERRVMPNVISDGIVGVSPMCAPKGEIFKMRYKDTPTANTVETTNK